MARRAHDGQLRKGTAIPYLSHPLAVAALVLEHGADEDKTIGALLHDVVEDGGGRPALDAIMAEFGDRVAAIVAGCSDTMPDPAQPDAPKAPWLERKTAYIEHLKTADPSTRLVAAADKLHNARTIRDDYLTFGEALWERFTADRSGVLWYFRSLVEVLEAPAAAPDDAALPDTGPPARFPDGYSRLVAAVRSVVEDLEILIDEAGSHPHA